MKISPALSLLALSAPLALPLAARAQTADVPAVAALPMAPKSAATSDAFVWRFAPPVGSHWTMRSFARSTWLLETPAMEGIKRISITFTTIRKFNADYDVLSRDALGATTIRLTLREMTDDVTSVSDGKPDKKSASDVTDPKAVAGATLIIKQAPNGAVWGVVGARAFQRKVLEVSGLSDKNFIDSMVNTSQTEADQVVGSLRLMLGTLPVSPVRLGESWSYPVSPPATSKSEWDINGTRTLKDLDSEIAVVSDSVSFTGDNSGQKPPSKPDVSKRSTDYIKVSVSESGTSRVQRSSGLPLETTRTQTLKGTMSSQTPAGAGAQNFIVPLDSTSTTRIVLKPRG